MKHITTVLDYYESALSKEFISSLVKASGERSGIFTSIVTIWLMIFQRLSSDKSLARAVEELRSGSSKRLLKSNTGSLKAKRGVIGNGTGSFASARKRLQVDTVTKVCDALNTSIIASHKEHQWEGLDVYVVDGTTIRLQYEEGILEEYPQYHNGHGKSHYPLMRIGIATHAVTGVALRPEVGPHNGPNAVGEITLGRRLVDRIPKKSIIIGDRMYGCFRFIYDASREHEVVCRIKESRLRKLINQPTSKSGEMKYVWQPSSRERKKYPELSADASIEGRLVWCTVERDGFRPIFLALFTTTQLSIRKLVELYGIRWNVETDLRHIKTALNMHMLSAKSPDMIHKETILGVTAYNLVRHLVGVTASYLKVNPREISFARVLKRIDALGGLIADNPDTDFVYKTMEEALSQLRAFILPKRKKRRETEPRKRWPKSEKNFMKGSREMERQKIRNSQRD